MLDEVKKKALQAKSKALAADDSAARVNKYLKLGVPEDIFANPDAFRKLHEIPSHEIDNLLKYGSTALEGLMNYELDGTSNSEDQVDSIDEQPSLPEQLYQDPDVSNEITRLNEEDRTTREIENNTPVYDLLANGGRRVQLEYPVLCAKQSQYIDQVTIRRVTAKDLGTWGGRFIRHNGVKVGAKVEGGKKSKDIRTQEMTHMISMHFINDQTVTRNCIAALSVEGLTPAEVDEIDLVSFRKLQSVVIDFFGN